MCSTRANKPYVYTQGSAFTAARRRSAELDFRYGSPTPHDNHTHDLPKIIDTATTTTVGLEPNKISQILPPPSILPAGQDPNANTEVDPTIFKELTQTLETSPRKCMRPRSSTVDNHCLKKLGTHTEKLAASYFQTARQEAKHSPRSYSSFNDLRSLHRTVFRPKPCGPRLMRSTSGLGFSKSSSASSLAVPDLSLEEMTIPPPPLTSHGLVARVPVTALDGEKAPLWNDKSIYTAPTLKQRRSLRLREQKRIAKDSRLARRRGMGLALGGEGWRNVALEAFRRAEREGA